MGDINQLSVHPDVAAAFTSTSDWFFRLYDKFDNEYEANVSFDLSDPTTFYLEKAGPVSATLRTHAQFLPTTTGGTEVDHMFSMHVFWTLRADSPTVQYIINFHSAHVEPSRIFVDEFETYGGTKLDPNNGRFVANETMPGVCFFKKIELWAPQTYWSNVAEWSDPLDNGWTTNGGNSVWELVGEEIDNKIIDLVTYPNLEVNKQLSYTLAQVSGSTWRISFESEFIGSGGQKFPANILSFQDSTLDDFAKGSMSVPEVGDRIRARAFGEATTFEGTLTTVDPTVSQSSFEFQVDSGPIQAGEASLLEVFTASTPLHCMPPMREQVYRGCFYVSTAANADVEAASIAKQEGWGTCLDVETPSGRTYSWQNPDTAGYLAHRYNLPRRDLTTAAAIRSQQRADVYLNAFAQGGPLTSYGYPDPLTTSPYVRRCGIFHVSGATDGGQTGGNEIYMFPGFEIVGQRSPKCLVFYHARNRSVLNRHCSGFYKDDGRPATRDELRSGMQAVGVSPDFFFGNLGTSANGLINSYIYPNQFSGSPASNYDQPIGAAYAVRRHRQAITRSERPWYMPLMYPGGDIVLMPYGAYTSANAPVDLSGAETTTSTPLNSLSYKFRGYQNMRTTHTIRAFWSVYPVVWFDNDPLERIHALAAATICLVNTRTLGNASVDLFNNSGVYQPSHEHFGNTSTGRDQGWFVNHMATACALEPANSALRQECVDQLKEQISTFALTQMPLPGSGMLQSLTNAKAGAYSQSNYGARAAQILEHGILLHGLLSAYYSVFKGQADNVTDLSGSVVNIDSTLSGMLRRMCLGLWRYAWQFKDAQGRVVASMQGYEGPGYTAGLAAHNNVPVSPVWNRNTVTFTTSTGSVQIPGGPPSVGVFQVCGPDRSGQNLAAGLVAADMPYGSSVTNNLFYPITGALDIVPGSTGALPDLPVPGNPADPANAAYYIDASFAPNPDSVGVAGVYPYPASSWVDPFPTAPKPAGWVPPGVGAAPGFKTNTTNLFTDYSYPSFTDNYVSAIARLIQGHLLGDQLFIGGEVSEMLRMIRASVRNLDTNDYPSISAVNLSEAILGLPSGPVESAYERPLAGLFPLAQQFPDVLNADNGDPVKPAWPPTTF